MYKTDTSESHLKTVVQNCFRSSKTSFKVRNFVVLERGKQPSQSFDCPSYFNVPTENNSENPFTAQKIYRNKMVPPSFELIHRFHIYRAIKHKSPSKMSGGSDGCRLLISWHILIKSSDEIALETGEKHKII